MCARSSTRPSSGTARSRRSSEKASSAASRSSIIVDPRRRAEHESQLAAGIGTIGGLSPGQHDVLTWDDAYLRDGYFDPDRMIAQLTALLTDGERRYPLVRLAAHMEWALEDRPGVERLVEYETRLNYTLLGSKNPVI